MSALTTIREVIEGFEAQIEAAPALGVYLFDHLTSPDTMPQQRGAYGVAVRRELTRNLDQNRNQDVSRVEDLIVVEVLRRLGPKSQKTQRGQAHDLEASILNRVTQLDWERRWGVTHMDTREQVLTGGEWLKLILRFSVKRFESVGQG